MTDLAAENVAFHFSRIVREELAEHLDEIRARNASPAYSGGVCATHDFCDANELMADAFKAATGRDARPELESDARLWSRAWGLAKAREFRDE